MYIQHKNHPQNSSKSYGNGISLSVLRRGFTPYSDNCWCKIT